MNYFSKTNSFSFHRKHKGDEAEILRTYLKFILNNKLSKSNTVQKYNIQKINKSRDKKYIIEQQFADPLWNNTCLNQMTNGPVNAHLISEPTISINQTKPD